MAPEVYRRKYNLKCDVWSMGIMLYKMLTGSFPYVGDTDEILKQHIESGEVYYGMEWKNLIARGKDTVLKSLLHGMLNTDVSERFTSK
jgi:calcium-dependent protein kinase